jgi:hypothetical protein
MMHLDKPTLAAAASQAAGAAFVSRLLARVDDLEPASGAAVVKAQMAAFREWEQSAAEAFAELARIHQPCLVVAGIRDR